MPSKGSRKKARRDVEHPLTGTPLDAIQAAFLDLTARIEAKLVSVDEALLELQGHEVVDAAGHTWRIDPISQSFVRRAPEPDAPWLPADPTRYADHEPADGEQPARRPAADREPAQSLRRPPVDREPAVRARRPPVDHEPGVPAPPPPVDREPAEPIRRPPVDREPGVSAPRPPVPSPDSGFADLFEPVRPVPAARPERSAALSTAALAEPDRPPARPKRKRRRLMVAVVVVVLAAIAGMGAAGHRNRKAGAAPPRPTTSATVSPSARPTVTHQAPAPRALELARYRPTALKAVPAPRQAVLSWRLSPDAARDGAGIIIRQQPADATGGLIALSRTGGGLPATYVAVPLTPGQRYCFLVGVLLRKVNGSTALAQSGPVCVVAR